MSETLSAASVLNSPSGGLVSEISSNLLGGGVGGNRSYYRGLPIIMRDSRYAKVHNKANRTIQAMPRQKFLYYASFVPGSAISSLRDFESWQRGFAFQIKRTDRVKASPQVKELNQYNRKRLIQTGIEYDALNLELHDTVDDRVLRVWRDYHVWYFGDGRGKNPSTTWRSSVISRDMPVSNGWGFSPPDSTPWDTQFFDSLDIYTFYGRKYTQVRFFNPKITSISFDAMDSSSSEMSSVDMTIKHEGFEYVNVAAPLGSKHITMFNLNSGDYYEPQDLFGGVNAFLLDLNDNLESSIDSLLGGIARNVPFVGQALAGAASNAIVGSGVTGFTQNLAQGLATTSLGRWGNFR
jgi:hypothetical protein